MSFKKFLVLVFAMVFGGFSNVVPFENDFVRDLRQMKADLDQGPLGEAFRGPLFLHADFIHVCHQAVSIRNQVFQDGGWDNVAGREDFNNGDGSYWTQDELDSFIQLINDVLVLLQQRHNIIA